MKKDRSYVLGIVLIVLFMMLFIAAMSFEILIEHKTPGNLIGSVESIQLITPNGVEEIAAKIDTGAQSSSIDIFLAKKLGIYFPNNNTKRITTTAGVQTRETINGFFFLDNKFINTTLTLANRSQLTYKLLIGRNDLQGFIIDPKQTSITRPKKISDLRLALANSSILLIMIIPILSLVIVFIRQVIGVKTYGLFAPLIISLSFETMGLKKGLLIYFIFVGLGIVSDKLLNKLQLLFVSRTSINLHFLSIIVVSTFLLFNISGFKLQLSIPFVILAHIFERFNKTSESEGHAEAFKLLLNTFAAACLTYFLGDMLLTLFTPVQIVYIIFISLILSFFLASYSGVRLTELIRFQGIRKND